MGTYHFCDDCHDYNIEAEATHLHLTVYNWKEKRDLCDDCYEERKRMGCIKESQENTPP